MLAFYIKYQEKILAIHLNDGREIPVKWILTIRIQLSTFSLLFYCWVTFLCHHFLSIFMVQVSGPDPTEPSKIMLLLLLSIVSESFDDSAIFYCINTASDSHTSSNLVWEIVHVFATLVQENPGETFQELRTTRIDYISLWWLLPTQLLWVHATSISLVTGNHRPDPSLLNHAGVVVRGAYNLWGPAFSLLIRDGMASPCPSRVLADGLGPPAEGEGDDLCRSSLASSSWWSRRSRGARAWWICSKHLKPRIFKVITSSTFNLSSRVYSEESSKAAGAVVLLLVGGRAWQGR